RSQHGSLPDECRRYFTIRTIIDMQVKDVVETGERLITRAGVRSADEVRLCPTPLVQHSPERRKQNAELRRYLYRNLYYSPVVNEPHIRARQLLRDLFAYYVEHPRALGEQARKRIRKVGLHRAVCDYLAGMTDRYAIQEHQRIFPARRAPGRSQTAGRR
ncbi:MAG TPA: deoxyguanosinetriphosphate triphosphohydrolase, partial [Verrucomicrobiota bacterium]|nr:deoxyguanosinetriphosphate triphosphohydrolase [Verrucomicrobiota bacterium]